MPRPTKKILFTLVLGSLAALVLAAVPAAAGVPRVAVFPFTVNAQENMGFLERGVVDMMSSRLSADGRVSVVEKSLVVSVLEKDPGPLTPRRADELAGQLDADYAVWGSVTVFGQAVSLDAWVKKAGDAQAPHSVVNQVQGMDQVISGVDSLAKGVRDQILGAAPVAAPPPAPAASALPQNAHPDRLMDRAAAPAPVVAAPPAVVRTAPAAVERTRPETGFWKSPAMRTELCGIVCADVDGDGQNEVVAMDKHTVWVKRFIQDRLVNVAEMEGPSSRKNLWLDAGDINGNGKAEIFVTALGGDDRLESFVLEYAGTGPVAPGPGSSGFKTVSEDRRLAFRVVEPLGGGLELYGQAGGSTDTFLPGVFRLTPSGGGYDKGDRLSLPDNTLVFGIARGDMGQGAPALFAVDDRERLRAYDVTGERLWKDSERSCGTEKRVYAIPGDQDSRVIFLPGRVMAENSPAGAGPEVILAVNEGPSGKLFSRFRLYTTASVQGLYWDGLGFAPSWNTREISGYMPDFALADVDNDGAPELVCAVVQERDTLGKSGKSAIIIYEISQLGE